MLHLPLFPGLRLLSFTFLICVSVGGLRAQTTDGSTLQEKPGIALIKPQAWSKENEATVYEFLGFFDRSSGGGGYYEFHTKADKRQVPTSRIVKIVIYPDPTQIKEVTTPEDRQKIAAAIDDLKSVGAKYPNTTTYLTPSLKKLSDEIAQYDAGKVKTGGVWVSKDSFVTEKATNLVNLLKADVASANPPSSFEFATDPKVVALQDIAATNPKIKQSLDEITTRYNKALRKEKRDKILTRLAQPNMPMSEAQTAVAQLKTLEPAEDSKSVLFIKSWDAGTVSIAEATAQAATLAPLLEKELSGVQITDAPPELSADLNQQISALNDKMKQFLASKPSPQLISASGRALAVSATGPGFTKLKTLFASRQFLDAKEIADDLARQAHQVGPETARVVAALQSYAAGQIKEFTSIREEAKLLADAGKPADALAKYEAAYKVIPESGVGDTIAQLKLAVPSPTPKK